MELLLYNSGKENVLKLHEEDITDMEERMTISASSVKPVLQYIAKKGIDLKEVLRGIKVDLSELESPTAKVTAYECDLIVQRAGELAKDDDVGLHIGEFHTASGVNIVSYIIMSCNTIGEALEKFLMYQELITQFMRTTASFQENHVILEHSFLVRELKTQRHMSEWMMSTVAANCRIMTDPSLPIAEVRFNHKHPGNITEHMRIFNAPIKFGQSMNALVFEKKYLDYTIIHSNKHLMNLFEQHAQAILGMLKADNYYASKIIHMFTQRGETEFPKIEAIARKLGMSARNLQLKLKEEKTSYQMLLDKFRLNAAKEYLLNRRFPISEISYLLGFSEPCVFVRAFKKWTDLTPKEYQKKVLKI